MNFHRAHTESELVRDSPVRKALRDELRNFRFPPRQRRTDTADRQTIRLLRYSKVPLAAHVKVPIDVGLVAEL